MLVFGNPIPEVCDDKILKLFFVHGFVHSLLCSSPTHTSGDSNGREVGDFVSVATYFGLIRGNGFESWSWSSFSSVGGSFEEIGFKSSSPQGNLIHSVAVCSFTFAPPEDVAAN